MLKMFLAFFAVVYVILLLFLALREVGRDSVGDCEAINVVSDTAAITGYMESNLMEKIVEVLAGLLDEVRPARVVVGRIAKKIVEEGAIKGLGKVHLLYGTTSRDFGEQVLRAVLDFLRKEGFASVEVVDFLRPDDRYFYIFVGLC